MSLAIITIDTSSQECSLAVNGVLVNANDIYFSKYTNPDGVLQKDFSYSVETTEPDGMMKRMMHTMVPKDSPEYAGSKNGIISREIKTKDKLYKEVESFVNESNASVKVVKNGPTDTPYCVMRDGKKVKCYEMIKDAKDHMNRMMNEK